MANNSDKNVSSSSSSSSINNNNHNRTSQSMSSNSDQIPATGTGVNPPPAWTQIVRGGGGANDSEPSGLVTATVLTEQEGVVTAASASDSLPVTASVGNAGGGVGGGSRGVNGASSSSSSMEEYAVPECAENVNGNVSKKPVWKKQSNGDAESSGSTIGADWPSLPNSFQSTKKGSSSGSAKPLSEGASSSAAAAQSTEIPSSTYKNHSSSQNNPVLSRPRSFKNRHGSNGPANGGLIQSPAVSNSIVESGPSSHNSSTHKNSNWEGGHKTGSSSHSHGNSNRRANGGHYPRGNGNQNYGGRHDQDRGNRDWNLHRMDGHMQPPHVPRAFIRPVVPPPPPPMPSIAPPYIGPPFMQPYLGNPMGFHHPEMAMYYLPVPPPHQPIFFAPPLTELQQRILKQINYYFSPANLVKDQHLRRQMDREGWVHISIIAGFKKIAEMTDDIELILSSIRYSSEVEVLGDKVRKRFDSDKYILHTVQDPLVEEMQKVNLEGNSYSYGSSSAQPNAHTEAGPSNSSSGDSINRFQPSDQSKQ